MSIDSHIRSLAKEIREHSKAAAPEWRKIPPLAWKAMIRQGPTEALQEISRDKRWRVPGGRIDLKSGQILNGSMRRIGDIGLSRSYLDNKEAYNPGIVAERLGVLATKTFESCVYTALEGLGGRCEPSSLGAYFFDVLEGDTFYNRVEDMVNGGCLTIDDRWRVAPNKDCPEYKL